MREIIFSFDITLSSTIIHEKTEWRSFVQTSNFVNI